MEPHSIFFHHKYYMKTIDTIYLDMDGVLVDFRGGCEKLSAIEGFKVDWETVHSEGPEFWSNLDWTKEGKRFYYWLEKYCDENDIELCILSSVNYDDGITGKLEWLRNNCRIPSKNIYIVKTGKDKAKYASEKSLLIDDYGKNIKSFIMAGGKGIKFDSAGQVRQELLKLG